MQTKNRFAALMITMMMGTGIVTLPMGARASEEGKRNTTLALGAVAAGLLLTQKNKLPGVVVAAGAAYAYTQYNASIESRHEQEGYYGYDPNGYRYQDNQNTDYRNHNGYRQGNSNDYHNGHNSGYNDTGYRHQNGTNSGNYPNTYSNNNTNTYSNDGYRYGENGNVRNENYDGRRTQSGQNRTVRAARSSR